MAPGVVSGGGVRGVGLWRGSARGAAWLFRAGDFLSLAFGSVLGGIVVHAIAEALRNHLRLRPQVALGLAIVILLAVIGFLVWLFAVAFREQVNVLVTRLPGLADQFARYMAQSPVGAKIVDAVRAAFAGSRVAQDIGGVAEGAGELVLNALLVLVGTSGLAPDVSMAAAVACCCLNARICSRAAGGEIGADSQDCMRVPMPELSTTSVGDDSFRSNCSELDRCRQHSVDTIDTMHPTHLPFVQSQI